MKSMVGARLSLILTATLAALALQMAFGSGWWTVWCVVTGVLALVLIDQFKLLKPIPSHWGFVPILGAALYCLAEWQYSGLGAPAGAEACVHFILLCQTAAIFSDMAGPQIGMSLAGSLVLLLVAVKRQPSAWHLPILGLLLAAATAGLIFRAVLTREREYQTQMLRVRSAGADGFVPADRRFAGRVAALTLILTFLATGFGLFGFFFFPRVSFAAGGDSGGDKKQAKTAGEIREDIYKVTLEKDGGINGGGPGGPSGLGGGVAGYEGTVRLDQFGRILTEPGTAFQLTREKIDASKPLPDGYIYLRGNTLSRYAHGRWYAEARSVLMPLSPKPDDARWFNLDFDRDRNQLLGAGVSELLTVRLPAHGQPPPTLPQILFMPGAADSLDASLPSRPSRDSDGMVVLRGNVAATSYRWLTQIGSPGLHAEDPAACVNPYAVLTSVEIATRPALLELAGVAKGAARTDQAKALAILNFMRHTGGYSYTLDLPEPPKNFSDPIEYFLLESKRGHCACFATGYIMLARLNNLACRLATGYAVKVKPGQTAADVQNSDAHAWVEVYLADRGWVTVDPTPDGANSVALDELKKAGNLSAATPPKPGDPVKPVDPANTVKPPEPPPVEKDPITTFNPERQTALYDSLTRLLNYPLIPLPGLAIPVWLVLVLILVTVLAWRLRRWWFKREDADLVFGETVRVGGSRIAFYRRMLALMKSRGLIRRSNQSATEYAAYLLQRNDPGARAVAAITKVYLLMRFGMLPDAERRAAWQRFKPVVEERLKDLELLMAMEKVGKVEKREKM